jgi:hypothetical protein
MGFLADAALALDPALILARAGMPPDLWQASVLRSRPRRLLLNCSRQAGKTSVVAAAALDEALFNPPALVLLLSPSQRQSQELFRQVMQLHGRLGIAIEPEAESTLRIELPSGSRIIALPGKEQTVRGYASVSLLVIDEAARVGDDLYKSVRPMLAVSGGRIVCLSTPFGKRGFFFNEWTEGQDWERVRITADQCARIPASFLEEERRALPDSWFRQEYFCEFSDTEGAVFAYDDIERAFRGDFPSLFDRPICGMSRERVQ